MTWGVIICPLGFLILNNNIVIGGGKYQENSTVQCRRGATCPRLHYLVGSIILYIIIKNEYRGGILTLHAYAIYLFHYWNTISFPTDFYLIYYQRNEATKQNHFWHPPLPSLLILFLWLHIYFLGLKINNLSLTFKKEIDVYIFKFYMLNYQ